MMPTTPGISVVPADKAPDEGEPQVQSHTGRSRGIAASSRGQTPRSAEQRKEISYNLVQPSVKDWESQDPQISAQYYAQVEAEFFYIVDGYREQANFHAGEYRAASQSQRNWRIGIIIATGILGLINILAVIQILKETSQWIPTLLSAIAAFYAGCLTVALNVESFLNWSERAAGFRESRDLLLSRFREYSSKWVYYVEAYGQTPTACMNAGQLYRQLIDSDQDLRRKLQQLTDVQGRKTVSHQPVK